ncbi:hypothetical protein SFRURICE_010197 [Spodoptera frugiperda]|nr:hypothetical protein SFRURICE_010197 [Spodoptera frugiperda]
MPQPYVYSARDYGNMLMCLGEARGNASLALRIYRERHPNVRHPSDSRVITAAFQRVLENRPIAPAASGGGRPADVQTEERILEVVRRNPRLGTRSAAKLLRRRNGSVVSHWLVHKVLRRERMRPYKVHKVHALVPGDRERRLNYCRWLVGHQQRSRFIEHVIWTDEATFTRNGLWNRRNAHVWSQTNPYACQQTGRQTRWSVNVWAGIYNGQILGPVFFLVFFLPQRLDGARYLELINVYVDNFLDSLSLAEYRNTWFQHDGAPPHVVRSVRERLSVMLEDRWIGREH